LVDTYLVIPSLLKKRPSGPGWQCKSKGHVITTQRLILRAPKSQDKDGVRATLDDEVVYWQGFLEGEADLDQHAEEVARRKLQRRPYAEWWLICDRSSGVVIGSVSVHAEQHEYTECHVGLWLKEGWRGRGLGSETLASVISVLPHLGFETAIAGTRPDNEKAIKLFTKFSFTRVKTEPHTLPNGYTVPSLWLKLDVSKTSKSHCDLR
jgi:RimJ/RimL family protein N-acetyltransferase